PGIQSCGHQSAQICFANTKESESCGLKGGQAQEKELGIPVIGVGRARVLAVSIGQRGRQATPRGRGAAKRAGEHTKRVQGDTLRGLIVRGARWFLPANRGLSLVGTYRDQLADTR